METECRNLYVHRAKYDAATKKKFIEDKGIFKRNKDLILEFEQFLGSSGSSVVRRTKLIGQLRKMCHFLLEEGISLTLDKLKKPHIVSLVFRINECHLWTEATKADYRRALKQFYAWYKDEDDDVYSQNHKVMVEKQRFYNYLHKDVSISYKITQSDDKLIITEEDIRKVIDCRHVPLRDKAFLYFLHESGARIGEMLNLRIRDFTRVGSTYRVRIPPGKTGARYIRVAQCIWHLSTWLLNHPDKNNPDAYMWVSVAPHNRGAVLEYGGATKIPPKWFKVAGVDKKNNLHWFRHSRATIYAKSMTEAMMRKYFGWSAASRMPARYTHLRDEDIETAICQMQGIETEKEKKKLPVACPCCQEVNVGSALYCHRCQHPLQNDALFTGEKLVQSEINDTVQMMVKLLQNKETAKQFQDFCKNQSKQLQ